MLSTRSSVASITTASSTSSDISLANLFFISVFGLVNRPFLSYPFCLGLFSVFSSLSFRHFLFCIFQIGNNF